MGGTMHDTCMHVTMCDVCDLFCSALAHSNISAHTLTYLVCVLGEGGGDANTMHGTIPP